MLKLLFFACLCFIGLHSIAQLPAGRVIEATKTSISIPGEKSIGNLITIEGFHSYVFLKSCHQTRDSSGNYRTDFEIGNPNRIKAYQVMLILQFDTIADSVIFNTDGEPKHLNTTFASNRLGASYQASELSANATITVTIYSKKKVFTSITGVEAQLH